MSDDYDTNKRAVDECAERSSGNGESSEQAHRHWSERARDSDKTAVHRTGPRPVPTRRRIPIRIVVHKD